MRRMAYLIFNNLNQRENYMKRLVLLFTALLLTLGVMAGRYRNFRATAYIMAGDVNRIGTVENWEKSYA